MISSEIIVKKIKAGVIGIFTNATDLVVLDLILREMSLSKFEIIQIASGKWKLANEGHYENIFG